MKSIPILRLGLGILLPCAQAVKVVKEAASAHNKPMAVVLAKTNHYESVGLVGATDEQILDLRCSWGNGTWPALLTTTEKNALERERAQFQGNYNHQVSPIFPLPLVVLHPALPTNLCPHARVADR